MATSTWPTKSSFSSFVLYGSTSGSLTFAVPAVVTTYTITWPSAQGAGALVNDGSGNLSWSSTSGLTVGPFSNTSTANGLDITAEVLTLHAADGTNPGALSTTTQTIAGNKTFTGTIAASNLSGTNTGDVTLAAVGSTPGANGASLSGQVLTLQPADGSNPGLVTAGAQTIGGNKGFSGVIGVNTAVNTNDIIIGAGTHPSVSTTAQGIAITYTSNSANTANVRGSNVAITTAASTTVTAAINYRSAAMTLGSGGTITTFIDVNVGGAASHIGTNNAAISDVANPSGNWFIFQSGADKSQLGGALTVTGQLIGGGTATNDSASAGVIGEFTQSRITSNTNAPGATTAWADATSLSLTAGDWDVTGVVFTTLNGATMSGGVLIGISTTTGNSATGLQTGDNMAQFPVPSASTGDRSGTVPAYRMSLASTTTVYLKLNVTYSAGNPQYTCRLSARRVR